jgi:hypothetical protein
MFCINKDIVPFDKNWSKKFNFKWKWNPGVTIINALTSVFDMHIFCLKTILSSKDIDVTLTKLISNCHAQQSLLWLMRKDLVDSCTNKSMIGTKGTKQQIPKLGKLKSENFWNAIKPHLTTHIPFYKKFYGVDKRYYDTELSEKSHIKFVKNIYETSNKKKHNSQQQMLINIRNSESITMTNHVFNSNNINIFDNNTSITSTSSSSSSNINSKNLLFTRIKINAQYGYENVGISLESKFKLTITSCGGQRDKGYLNKDLQCESLNTALLSFEDFSKLFENNFKDIDVDYSFKEDWESVKLGIKQLQFLKSVNIIDRGAIEDSFSIYADNSFRHFQGGSDLRSNICSFVEIKWEYDQNEEKESQKSTDSYTSIAQIISIFNYINKNTDTQSGDKLSIYLLVAWMKDAPNTNNLFPNFLQYKYDITHSKKKNKTKVLNMSIISIDTVYRPAFMIKYAESGNNWEYNPMNITTNITELETFIFYSIPYLYTKRDSLAYDNSYQHWRYGNDTTTGGTGITSSTRRISNLKPTIGVNSSGSSIFTKPTISTTSSKHVSRILEISDNVYTAFLNEDEIEQVDEYLKHRFSDMRNQVSNDDHDGNVDDASDDEKDDEDDEDDEDD